MELLGKTASDCRILVYNIWKYFTKSVNTEIIGLKFGTERLQVPTLHAAKDEGNVSRLVGTRNMYL